MTEKLDMTTAGVTEAFLRSARNMAAQNHAEGLSTSVLSDTFVSVCDELLVARAELARAKRREEAELAIATYREVTAHMRAQADAMDQANERSWRANGDAQRIRDLATFIHRACTLHNVLVTVLDLVCEAKAALDAGARGCELIKNYRADVIGSLSADLLKDMAGVEFEYTDHAATLRLLSSHVETALKMLNEVAHD